MLGSVLLFCDRKCFKLPVNLLFVLKICSLKKIYIYTCHVLSDGNGLSNNSININWESGTSFYTEHKS